MRRRAARLNAVTKFEWVAMSEFLNMGGYAAFVWPAYLISGAVIGGLAASIWLRARRLRRALRDAPPQP